MKKVFAILVVLATVTAAVYAISDDQAKEMKLTAEQAVESELILEEWMVVPVFESVELESEVGMESWMMETDSYAGDIIELEDWMLKNSESTGTIKEDPVMENWMLSVHR